MRARLWMAACVVTTSAWGAPTFEDVSRTVFRPKCLECHGQPKPAANLDLSSLVSILKQEVIVPSAPDRSLLMEKVIAGEMPLGGDSLSDAEIALLRAWILAGAPDTPATESAVLKSIVPPFGPTNGGTAVTLIGAHLESVVAVSFGDVLCAELAKISDTELKCVTPARAETGPVDVTLRTADTTTTMERGFDYRLALAPTFDSLFVNIFRPKCLRCHNDEKPSHDLSVESYASIRSHRRAVIPYDLKRSRVYKKTREGEMPRGGPKLPAEEIRMIGAWIQKGAPER